MGRNIVTFNQLIAGSLLKFGKIDSVDVTLLMQGIGSIAEIVNYDYEHMDEYFIMADGSVILNDSYINKVYKSVNNNFLERIQGWIVKEYLDNLDMQEFVLRKIKLLGNGCALKDDLIHAFSILQINTIIGLYKERYIMDYCHQDSVYSDYQAIKLTKRGELNLFLKDNKIEIDKFSKLLKENGYDNVLVQAFLISQDLNRNPIDILTIDNFISFCNEFDKCPYVGIERKGYSKRRAPVK